MSNTLAGLRASVESNGANVLFHQLKQLYHVVVCVECYQRVFGVEYVQMLVLCLVGCVCAFVFKVL